MAIVKRSLRKTIFKLSTLFGVAVFFALKIVGLSDASIADARTKALELFSEGRIINTAHADTPSGRGGETHNHDSGSDHGNPQGDSSACAGSSGSESGGGGPCFVKGAAVQMADGTTKLVERIQIGDLTKGGKVIAVMQYAIGDSHSDIYDYRGTLVVGAHAVLEDGEWKRVRDAKHAVPAHTSERVVYDFNTTEHRIYIDDGIFGDGVELDWDHPVEITYFNDAIKALNDLESRGTLSAR